MGIMAVYSISGILLIYRDTDFLKKEQKIEKTIAPNFDLKELGRELKIKELKIEKEEGSIVYFKQGTYNKSTGEAKYTKKELPFVLKKMTELHKSDSKHKYHLLNTLFGVCLFFFVVSSFWMFAPKSKIFKKGMIYAAIGFVLSLILLFV
jgi:hypothetical protein